jgi:glyoxylase-like metal-dependent hydrolase (beta-lactamase superfamily II)
MSERSLTDPAVRAALDGLTLFERGWLSSNNVLVHGEGAGATLVDASHCLHGEQTIALVRHALQSAGQGETLAHVVNTHLHSDHCGGNAALARAFGAPLSVPAASWQAVQDWDVDALSYRPSGQRCEQFQAHGRLETGAVLDTGPRRWQVLSAPGHDPDSVMLFDDDHGVLISADALWANGFGVVFPELEGEQAFDDVGAVLDLIERLPVRVVIPGHGAPFTDVAGALQRARARLASFRAEPQRHSHHAAKVLLKYHLLEEGRQPLADVLCWVERTPLARAVWQRLGRPHDSLVAWGQALIEELEAAGALMRRDGEVHNN